jgi:hypothetical protein
MVNAARWLAFGLFALLAASAAAQDMPHDEVPFNCTRCHVDSEDRSQIEFDHSDTEFELEGLHVSVSCGRCHDLADFARADDRCVSCHTDVHQGRLYPECGTCHSPDGWDVLDPYGLHSRTAFQLMGAHVRLDCDACHTREIVAERSVLTWDCYGCHRADYEATQSPSHVQFGFDTDCESCHMMMAWHPTTTRQHPGAFPIFSGTHAGEWDSCNTCHVNPNDYSDFSCFGCHKHNESDMAEEHDDVEFYIYDSSACYGCHPTGSAEGEDD